MTDDVSGDIVQPRRLLLPGLAILLVAAIAVGVGYWTGARSARSLPTVDDAPVAAYASVERRVVADTQGVACLVAAAEAVAVPAPEVAAGMRKRVTSVRLSTGDKAESGTVIAEVSGIPILLLHVDGVLYRDIRVGDSGSDVLALTRALRRQGVLASESTSFMWREGEALRALYAASSARVPVDEEGRPVFSLDSVVLIPKGVGRVVEGPILGADMTQEETPVSRLVFGTLRATCRVPLDLSHSYEQKETVEIGPMGVKAEPVTAVIVGKSSFRAKPGTATGADGGSAVPGNELPGYDIELKPANPLPAWFQAGRIVTARPQVTQVAETLAVPLAALRQRGTDTYVVVKRDPTDIEISVSVLRQADGWVAVTGSGLEGASVRVTP